MKNILTFESFINEKSSLETICDSLFQLDTEVKDDLGISSADPVYNDRKKRNSWMNGIKDGLIKIGLPKIKQNWNKISSELENENYHQLNLFIELSLIKNEKIISRYQNKIEFDKSKFNNNDAIKDFIEFKI
jgi:hypothetical protein